MSFLGEAQSVLIPFSDGFSYRIDKALVSERQAYFSSVSPLIINNFSFDADSVLYLHPRDTKLIANSKHPIWWKKIRTEHLIQYRKDGIAINIDPIIHFSKSSYYKDYFLTQNTRGVELTGSVGRKFSFTTGFSENQMFFPDYLSAFIKKRAALPGLGRSSKPFKDRGYDFSEAHGWISVTPFSFLNLQIGHAKQFVGDGYRSLVQSYNSFNIPFAKLTTTLGKWRYVNLFQAFQTLSLADATTEIEGRRYNSTHILSYLPAPNFEISLIESVVFAPKRKGDYLPNINLFNPIIGYRSLQYDETSEQNVLSAINLRWDVFRAVRLYSQFVYNGEEKYGFQFGAKSYHLFNLPLMAQVEYNKVTSGTYTHHDTQSFVNANQELAHPLGNNFTEWVGKIGYHWKDFYFNAQINMADVNRSYSFSPNTPQASGSITNLTLECYYLINPVNNLSLFFRYRQRDLELNHQSEKQSFYTFGIRTNTTLNYTDF